MNNSWNLKTGTRSKKSFDIHEDMKKVGGQGEARRG